MVDAGTPKANAVIEEWTKKAEASGLDALRDVGMQVYVNTPEEQAQFAELIRPVYEKTVGPDIAKMFVPEVSTWLSAVVMGK